MWLFVLTKLLNPCIIQLCEMDRVIRTCKCVYLQLSTLSTNCLNWIPASVWRLSRHFRILILRIIMIRMMNQRMKLGFYQVIDFQMPILRMKWEFPDGKVVYHFVGLMFICVLQCCDAIILATETTNKMLILYLSSLQLFSLDCMRTVHLVFCMYIGVLNSSWKCTVYDSFHDIKI